MERTKFYSSESPFPATPSFQNYLAVGSVEQANQRLQEAIVQREGIGLIVGPAGTGKSLLCTVLAESFRDSHDVVLLSESRLCTRRALLQHILHHLDLPYADRSEGELRLALIDRAARGGHEGTAGLLLIVDEAQIMPGRLLEELRLMAGIVRDGYSRVQLVLAGGMLLDERLSHPRMETLNQRIGARCYLHPLGRGETGQYIREAFRRQGINPGTLIDEEAIQAVYFASGGIPRLINQTMTRALSLCQRDACERLTAERIEMAWADLQQLPCPQGDEKLGDHTVRPGDIDSLRISSQSEVGSPFASIEFGTLESATDPMAETVDYEPVGTSAIASPDTEATSNASVTTDYSGLFGDGFDDEELIPASFTANPYGQTEAVAMSSDTPFVFAGSQVGDEVFLGSSFAIAGNNDSPLVDANDVLQQELDEAFWLHNEILSLNNDAVNHRVELTDEEFAEDEVAVPQIDTIVSKHASSGDIIIRDDSDMLVIEEDVATQTSEQALRLLTNRAPLAESSNVGFELLLTKLREG